VRREQNRTTRRQFVASVASFGAVVSVTQAEGGAQSADLPGHQIVSDAEIARLIKFAVERQRRGSGIVVGVLRPSGRSVLSYGVTSLEGGHEMDGTTLFEIASLTKVFTALMFADAAVRGEAGLNDPLSRYVPPGVATPQFAGRAITLTDLATHTSGLPLRPDNLHAAPDAPNKYAGYSLRQLYDGLPDYKLTRPPGSAFEYSNVDYALLGQGLALRLRRSYPELLRTRITGPLGMADTALAPPPSAKRRTAQGYDIDLNPVAPTDEGALYPGGGLRSTVDDLLRLLDLCLNGRGPGRLPDAARLMLSVDRPGDDKDTRMALGWRRATTNGETYFWSAGSSDGSRTFMGFNPRRKIAVVALANASSGEGVDDIGRHVLDPAYPADLKIMPVRHEISLPAGAMDRFLGSYQYAPGDKIEVTRGVTGLLAASGASQFVIYPETPARFFAKIADLEFDFEVVGSDPASALVLHQDGQNYRYKRVP
jgi:CubicO group peptidase (beta-lactamase class C family)